jgi:hypothetical protein
MSSSIPVPSPKRGPTIDSLDTVTIIAEDDNVTRGGPVDPKHLPHIREMRRLLEERERKRREQGQPPPSPPTEPPSPPGG